MKSTFIVDFVGGFSNNMRVFYFASCSFKSVTSKSVFSCIFGQDRWQIFLPSQPMQCLFFILQIVVFA